jgi:hypothetical protein
MVDLGHRQFAILTVGGDVSAELEEEWVRRQAVADYLRVTATLILQGKVAGFDIKWSLGDESRTINAKIQLQKPVDHVNLRFLTPKEIETAEALANKGSANDRT